MSLFLERRSAVGTDDVAGRDLFAAGGAEESQLCAACRAALVIVADGAAAARADRLAAGWTEVLFGVNGAAASGTAAGEIRAARRAGLDVAGQLGRADRAGQAQFGVAAGAARVVLAHLRAALWAEGDAAVRTFAGAKGRELSAGGAGARLE
jgi:hypothetical protein